MPIHLLLVSNPMFTIILRTLCANLPSMNALDNRQKSGKQRNSNVDNDLTRSEISLQARTLGSRSIIIIVSIRYECHRSKIYLPADESKLFVWI